jgi:hypothetical protein
MGWNPFGDIGDWLDEAYDDLDVSEWDDWIDGSDGGGGKSKGTGEGSQDAAYGRALGWIQGNQSPELSSQAPGRIYDFKRDASRAIEQMSRSALLGQSDAIMGRMSQANRQAADAAALQGLAPSAYYSSLAPQRNMEIGQMMGSLSGQTQAQQSQMQMDLSGNILNAMNQLESYYDSLKLQKDIAKEVSKNAKRGQEFQLGGTVISSLGDFASSADQ